MNIKIDKALYNANDGSAVQCYDYLGYRYPVSQLIDWSKKYKAFKMPLKHLNWSRTVVDDLNALELAQHMKQSLMADLSYPIILAPDGVILDGGHRLAKAFLTGQSYIMAVRLKSMPPCSEKTPE